jgi:hypothetical protein
MDFKKTSKAPQGRIKNVEVQAAANLQKEDAGGSSTPPDAGGQTKYKTHIFGNQVRYRCPYCQRDDYDSDRLNAHVQFDHHSAVRSRRRESQARETPPKPDESAQMPRNQEAQGPKDSRKGKRPVRRNQRYKVIDEAFGEIAKARPKNHEEVFRLLEDREVPIPNRKPFKSTRGWVKGFNQDRHAASAWLSQTWGRLGLPAFARGPKK